MQKTPSCPIDDEKYANFRNAYSFEVGKALSSVCPTAAGLPGNCAKVGNTGFTCCSKLQQIQQANEWFRTGSQNYC